MNRKQFKFLLLSSLVAFPFAIETLFRCIWFIGI